jgi:hypothetical protein
MVLRGIFGSERVEVLYMIYMLSYNIYLTAIGLTPGDSSKTPGGSNKHPMAAVTVTGELRKLHNEELNDLYSSSV